VGIYSLAKVKAAIFYHECWQKRSGKEPINPKDAQDRSRMTLVIEVYNAFATTEQLDCLRNKPTSESDAKLEVALQLENQWLEFVATKRLEKNMLKQKNGGKPTVGSVESRRAELKIPRPELLIMCRQAGAAAAAAAARQLAGTSSPSEPGSGGSSSTKKRKLGADVSPTSEQMAR
jgi:hypothetical protein